MTREELTERLAAVERTLTDSETTPADLSGPADVESRLDALETRLSAFEKRLADAEGDLAAVRGHVGEECDAERTATRALATAREVESRLEEETPAPRERPVPVSGAADERGLFDRLRERW